MILYARIYEKSMYKLLDILEMQKIITTCFFLKKKQWHRHERKIKIKNGKTKSSVFFLIPILLSC